MSKATNENYIIRIKSYIDQFDSEGNTKEEDRDHIELMTRGSLVKKGEQLLYHLQRDPDHRLRGLHHHHQDRRGRQPGGSAPVRPRQQPAAH